MRRHILNLLTLSAVLLAVSCNKVNELPDEPVNVGKLLMPELSVKGEYTNNKPNPLKSNDDATVSYNLKNFYITILQYDSEGALTPVKDKKWKVADMPAKVGLGVGNYAMQVASYDGKQLDVSDNPYFFGTTDFSIAFELETTVKLDVTVADAKVSMVPTDAFKEAFTDWSMQVVTKANLTEPLCELNENTLDKYIKPTDVVLKIQGTRRNSPVTWTQEVSYDNVKAGDWLKVSLDRSAVGTVTINITVDNTLTEREVIVEIPNDDEDLGGGGTVTPDPEEPDEPEPPVVEKPSIAGLDGLNIDEPLVISKADAVPPVKIEIKAENGGINKLNVKIESQEEWFMTAVKAMFEGGNTFDLANLVDDSNTKNSLLSLGIISKTTVIKGEKSFIFDITSFMALLSVNDPATNSYDFTIGVEDNGGGKLEKKLVVKVVK